MQALETYVNGVKPSHPSPFAAIFKHTHTIIDLRILADCMHDLCWLYVPLLEVRIPAGTECV